MARGRQKAWFQYVASLSRLRANALRRGRLSPVPRVPLFFFEVAGAARANARLHLPNICRPLPWAINFRSLCSPIKSIVNLKNLHKCLIYADFTLLVYRHAGEAVCLPYPLRPRRELLALSFGFLSAALPLIRGEFRTLHFPPLAATCRCIHL